jgi:hemerythrin-like metal-binding protein
MEDTMAFIDWTPDLSVGVAAIDKQHTKLIHIINTLHEVMLRGGTPVEVAHVLKEVVSYAKEHFGYEERMLERAGYPALAEHRAKHQAMFVEIEVYVERVRQGSNSISIQLMSFLKNWLVKHIKQTDKAYSAHVIAARSNTPPVPVA